MATKRTSRTSDITPKVARRSSSATLAAEMATRLASELACLFQCVACGERVRPPIVQCCMGHLACVACRDKDNTCPECLGPIGDVRVPSMERVAAILFTPCRHSVYGCREQLTICDQWEHEETCSTVTFGVDDADGAWFGKRLRLQSCFERHFLLVFWREHEDACRGCCVLAQLVGEPHEVDRFTYQVDVTTRNGVRSLTWRDRPRSILESVDSTLVNRDCLFFDARQFTESGRLNVDITVHDCEDREKAR
ncbi:E3 ubiquitin-protein ligase sina [Rhipicephalus sanguineus]|uniref:E3 ubiquitin-protein ligase sina n=1 Tax=Rhipicephalus sanguineus TaxID=34632 RepID=UPI0018949BB8|nr:E3 ubiquitin-protein ligase sina [Rhipicephalus sanguineus]XP_037503107.1 E3 ubiquitin-protein ligase sina [Rhipicephalus sanguineus]